MNPLFSYFGELSGIRDTMQKLRWSDYEGKRYCRHRALRKTYWLESLQL